MAARPGARTKLVYRSTLKQTEEFLKQLPQKEKDHVSLQEAIGNVAESIREAIAKGHSYDELAGLLSEQFGVSVSAWSLKRYLSLGSKQSGVAKATPKNGRRRRLKAETESGMNPAERNGQVAIAQVNSTPLLTLVPDSTPAELTETEPATSTKVRKARTPRTPSADKAAPKRQTSAAKTKSAGRKAKADAAPAPKTGRRKKAAPGDA